MSREIQKLCLVIEVQVQASGFSFQLSLQDLNSQGFSNTNRTKDKTGTRYQASVRLNC